MKRKKKKWLLASIVLISISGVTALIGYSYAYLSTTVKGEKTYSLKVKNFSFRLDDSKTPGNIQLENTTPVSDSVGKTGNAYTFAVINEDVSQTGYVIYLDDVEIDDEINRMKDMNIKYQLIENGVEHVGFVSDLGANPFRILTSGIINANTTNNYSLRFWIKEGAEVATNQSFSVKIRVVATAPDAIQEGKLIFGETDVASDNEVTQMTPDQLQAYVDRALGNENEINQTKKETLDKAYPVGSVYITEKNTNPSELFGGTWERYGVGKTLVGTDTTSNQTGGSTTATITVENLPSHSHNIEHTHSTAQATIASSGAHTHTTTQATTYTMSLTAGTSGSNHTHSTTAATLNFPISVSGLTIGWLSTGIAGYIGGGFHTSGTENVTITIPALSIASSGAHSHSVTGNITIPALSVASSGAHTHTVPSLSTNSISTKNSGATGGGKAISVQDPYITVFMWKRVS